MSNFPVNPDLATSSEIMYSPVDVVAQFGKNFNLSELQPASQKRLQRRFSYVQDPATAYNFGLWNDEATNDYQRAEFENAYALLNNNYILNLLPNWNVIMLVITNVEIHVIHSGNKVHCDITFDYIPFVQIP